MDISAGMNFEDDDRMICILSTDSERGTATIIEMRTEIVSLSELSERLTKDEFLLTSEVDDE